MNRRFTLKEVEFLFSNYESRGASFCAEVLKRPKNSIIDKAGKLGLKVSNITLRRLKLETRAAKRNQILEGIDFMKKVDLTDPCILYILGLIWADGSVYIGNENVFNKYCCLSIEEKDGLEVADIIPLLKIEKEWKVGKITTPAKKHWKPLISFHNFDWLLGEFLSNLDFLEKSKKPPEKLLSLIPPEKVKYFILGYFDGDGCVSIGKGNDKSRLNIVFTSCFEQDWDFLVKFMASLDITCTVKRYKRKKGNNSSCSITKREDCYRFLKTIYKDRDSTSLGFSRKHQKLLEYEDYIKTRKNHLGDRYKKYN